MTEAKRHIVKLTVSIMWTKCCVKQSVKIKTRPKCIVGCKSTTIRPSYTLIVIASFGFILVST